MTICNREVSLSVLASYALAAVLSLIVCLAGL